ncbi:DUF1800 family protein [Isosphaeraceae bacterium EP7]
MGTDPESPWDGEPAAAWEPYDPSRDGAWDLARVAHLHRRAGFGAGASRLARDVSDGHEASIRRIVEGDPVGPDGRTRAEFDDLAGSMTDSARRDPAIGRVRLAWLFRLLNGPHPLQERMTLAWHGHYATGARKVADPLAMLDQVEAMRGLWNAPVSKLHRAMLDSAAMQLWLDGPSSDRDRPNENLGREFLELFALGEGAYGEGDVKAAARALTGYRVGGGADLRARSVVFDPKRHDGGEKLLLGETGPWGPADLVRIASKQPPAARAVARRLFLTFIDDITPPPAPLVDALADLIRTPGDVDVARGIRVVLGSRCFHSGGVRGRKVKSPVDFVVGLIRTTGWFRPTPDPITIDVSLTRMGQTLLDPPSVAGWSGGYSWLGAPLLIARANFMAEITSTAGAEAKLRTLHGKSRGGSPSSWGASVAGAFAPCVQGPGLRGAKAPASYAEALRLVASYPEAHLA